MSKSVVLIDRDYILSALGVFNDTANGDWDFLTGIETAKEIVRNAPTIDAVDGLEKRNEPIKPNVILTTGAGIGLSHCPKCGESIDEYHHPSFCGNCGQEIKWK